MFKIVILGVLLLSSLLTLTYSSFIPLNVRSGLTWHSQACQTLGGELLADDDLIMDHVKTIAMNLDVCIDDNIAAFWTAKKKQKILLILKQGNHFHLDCQDLEGNQNFVQDSFTILQSS